MSPVRHLDETLPTLPYDSLDCDSDSPNFNSDKLPPTLIVDVKIGDVPTMLIKSFNRHEALKAVLLMLYLESNKDPMGLFSMDFLLLLAHSNSSHFP